jgi:hypothetical protein
MERIGFFIKRLNRSIVIGCADGLRLIKSLRFSGAGGVANLVVYEKNRARLNDADIHHAKSIW